jgi:5-methylcytosine-specific restriction endonuclease McrA
MAFDPERVRWIYDKHGGCCAYCGKRLSILNYGRHGERGAWHIDHRRSRFNGGTDHGNNLSPACIGCNLDKGARNAKSYQRTIQLEADGSGAGIGLGGLALLGLLLWGLSRRRPPGNGPWGPGP